MERNDDRTRRHDKQFWEWRLGQLTWERCQGCGSGGMKVKVTGLQVGTVLQARISDFQSLAFRITLWCMGRKYENFNLYLFLSLKN